MRLRVFFACIVLASGVPPYCIADESSYRSAVETARQLLSEGKFDAAVRTLEPWTQKLPDKAEAHHLVGFAYYSQQDFPNAIRHLESALRLEPKESEIRHQTEEVLGVAYYLSNRPADAAPLLEQAVKRGGADSRLRYTLAMCYVQTRNRERARGAYAELYGVPATSPQAALLTAGLMLQAGFDQDAEMLLLEVQKRQPGFQEISLKLGTIALRRGDHTAAAKLCRDESVRTPASSEVWHCLGESLLALGRTAEAQEALQRAVWLNARSAALLALLGRVYMDTGVMMLAENTLLQALQVDPNHYETHFLLSRLYHKTGRPERARHHLEILSKLRRGTQK